MREMLVADAGIGLIEAGREVKLQHRSKAEAKESPPGRAKPSGSEERLVHPENTFAQSAPGMPEPSAPCKVNPSGRLSSFTHDSNMPEAFLTLSGRMKLSGSVEMAELLRRWRTSSHPSGMKAAERSLSWVIEQNQYAMESVCKVSSMTTEVTRFRTPYQGTEASLAKPPWITRPSRQWM
jgi:hypothetical protein